MFLFLSKLLPLFVYPLGLTCLLLVVALVCFWQRPRVAATAIFLALLVLVMGSNHLVARALVRSLESRVPVVELPQAAAIVVLGGGTKPALPPRPWVDLSEEGDRALYGARLYRQGKAPLLILSGGRISWSGDAVWKSHPESQDMAEIVQAMGVPKQAILQDPDSLNTHENAVNVQRIIKTKGVQGQVLLVTSAFHMPRSLLIFKHQGIDAVAAPTDFLITNRDREQNFQDYLLALLPDADQLQRSTKALKEYVGLVIYRLRGWL